MNAFFETGMPTLEEVRARSVKPQQHLADVIVVINGHYVWRRREQLRPDERFAAFFDGDYCSVLEPDDPRVARQAHI